MIVHAKMLWESVLEAPRDAHHDVLGSVGGLDWYNLRVNRGVEQKKGQKEIKTSHGG
jgi:hypothetical protein